MNRHGVPLVSLGLAVGLAAGFMAQAAADRSGQLVFIPGGGTAAAGVLPESSEQDLGTWAIALRQCAEGREGLIVNGTVDGPTGGMVTIVVSGGDRDGPGVRTGRQQAAGLLSGATPGAFRVVLPWATLESTFSVTEGGGASGVTAQCP